MECSSLLPCHQYLTCSKCYRRKISQILSTNRRFFRWIKEVEKRSEKKFFKRLFSINKRIAIFNEPGEDNHGGMLSVRSKEEVENRSEKKFFKLLFSINKRTAIFNEPGEDSYGGMLSVRSGNVGRISSKLE
jgi:hypothetical protein